MLSLHRKRMSLLLFSLTFLSGCVSPALTTATIVPTTPVSTATAFQPSPTATHEVLPTATPSLDSTEISVSPTVASPASDPVLVGAGDISICGQDGDDQTAALLANIPGTIFTAGDNSNESGLMPEYLNCFGPSWGTMKDRIRPSAGNHEYYTGTADAYFDYFGDAAGPRDKGYYSYNLGDWHIVVLNSNCKAAGCSFESDQVAWLKADLEQNASLCTLAYYHHPRWSSGLEGSNAWLTGFWNTLYDYGVDVVVNGHEHDYERFAPQDKDGNVDEARGIREFVVGTGGVNHLGFDNILPISELRQREAFGVIKFTLHADSYDWEFIPVAGETFTDSGSGMCHL